MICQSQCRDQSDSFTSSKARWQQTTGVPTGARLDARLRPVGKPQRAAVFIQTLGAATQPWRKAFSAFITAAVKPQLLLFTSLR